MEATGYLHYRQEWRRRYAGVLARASRLSNDAVRILTAIADLIKTKGDQLNFQDLTGLLSGAQITKSISTTIMDWSLKSIASSFASKGLILRGNQNPTIPLHADVDEQSEPLMEEKDVESVGLDTQRPNRESSRVYRILLRSLAVPIALSLVLSAVVLVTQLRVPKGPSHGAKIMETPCGSSPEEATQKGCHFDVISFCWLPDECYDSELSEDFDHANELEWFLDPNRTQPLTHDEIMTGRYTGLYVNWEYHLRHCTAMWRKMHRAILGDLGYRAIDSYIGVYEHTKHCEQMLLGGQGIAFDLINTRIAVKYPDCGI